VACGSQKGDKRLVVVRGEAFAAEVRVYYLLSEAQ
jgi:hypothetical protein